MNIVSAILSLIVSLSSGAFSKLKGSSDPLTLRKAKFLKNMIKSYFRTCLLEGYECGLVYLND